MDLDATLRRIRKLLAIAADSRGDPHETAAAAAQAEKIMRKFNLDHADVLRAGMKRDGASAMASRRVKANMKRDDPGRTPLKRPPKWAGHLGFEVAMLHDVQVRYAHAPDMGGAVVEFRGFAADVEVAAWTFDYLVGQMILGVNAHGAACREEFGCPPSKTANAAFRDGFVSGLLLQLQRTRKEKDAEVAVHSAGTALVVAKQAAIAEHFGAVTYKEGTARQIRDGAAFLAGQEAGGRVDVARRAVGASAAGDASPRIFADGGDAS